MISYVYKMYNLETIKKLYKLDKERNSKIIQISQGEVLKIVQ